MPNFAEDLAALGNLRASSHRARLQNLCTQIRDLRNNPIEGPRGASLTTGARDK